MIEALGTVGTIAFYASMAASAAGSALSYDSSQKQARQVEMNAEAQADALAAEKARTAQEFAENQRRATVQHKRDRARQAAAMASSGTMTTTGTQLALLADTWQTQQTQLADQSYLQQLQQRELSYRASSALTMGRNEAGGIRAAATGTALSNLASTGSQAYGSFSTRPKKANTYGLS